MGCQHRGRLYRPQYRPVEPLTGPIRFENVSKVYQSWVTLEKLPPALQEVLRSFGVERRLIQKFVLRNLRLRVEPREVIALVGASGAGKTTVLRLLWGRGTHRPGWRYRPDGGRLVMPPNVRAEAYLPGEVEPEFGNLSVLEAVYRRAGDETLAIEILNAVGLSDAVLFRATVGQLSTGQRERANMAYLLAGGPNLLLIDEFCAHLDPALARRVARKVGELVRRLGITLVVATHRPEVLEALRPDHTLLVGYGGVVRLT